MLHAQQESGSIKDLCARFSWSDTMHQSRDLDPQGHPVGKQALSSIPLTKRPLCNWMGQRDLGDTAPVPVDYTHTYTYTLTKPPDFNLSLIPVGHCKDYFVIFTNHCKGYSKGFQPFSNRMYVVDLQSFAQVVSHLYNEKGRVYSQ